ncbi:hypothetical protein [Candidatus Nanopusillus massiliensis]
MLYIIHINLDADHYLSRLFSMGFFGYKINKKLVPSKWAIICSS